MLIGLIGLRRPSTELTLQIIEVPAEDLLTGAGRQGLWRLIALDLESTSENVQDPPFNGAMMFRDTCDFLFFAGLPGPVDVNLIGLDLQHTQSGRLMVCPSPFAGADATHLFVDFSPLRSLARSLDGIR